MDRPWLLLVQWVHVLAGIIWFGSAICMSVIVWPMLLRWPASEARAMVQAIGPKFGALMGLSSQVVLWLGILRGTVFGPIKSFGALFSTAYGWTFLTALVLTVVIIVVGAINGNRMAERVWEGDAFRPDAARHIHRNSAFLLTLFLLVLTCMILMRFGL